MNTCFLSKCHSGLTPLSATVANAWRSSATCDQIRCYNHDMGISIETTGTKRHLTGRRLSAFTLIELLVVIAIIRDPRCPFVPCDILRKGESATNPMCQQSPSIGPGPARASLRQQAYPLSIGPANTEDGRRYAEQSERGGLGVSKPDVYFYQREYGAVPRPTQTIEPIVPITVTTHLVCSL